MTKNIPKSSNEEISIFIDDHFDTVIFLYFVFMTITTPIACNNLYVDITNLDNFKDLIPLGIPTIWGVFFYQKIVPKIRKIRADNRPRFDRIINPT